MDIDVTSLVHRHAVQRWERVSVGDILERLTWSFPDQEAIIGWDGAYGEPEFARLTYRRADQLANQVANGLLGVGLGRGDRVMMVCENSVEAVIAKIGIAKAGLVAVPMNPHFAPDIVAALIERIEPAFLIVDAELWAGVEKPFTAAGIAPGAVIAIGESFPLPESPTFGRFVAEQTICEPDVEIHGDDIWQILFTSGTTSTPKAAMVSHHSSYFAAYSYAMTVSRGVRIENELRLASFLPIIFHASDQIFTLSVFLSGGTLLVGRGPNPRTVAEAISREAITTLWAGSPVMVAELAETLDTDRLSYDTRSLKTLLFGWAGLAPGAVAILKRLCGDDLLVVSVFGQTESISCHRFWPDRWPDTFRRFAPSQNNVGVPNPILASTLMDESGALLDHSPGTRGEAVYRSPAITAGYYKDAEATAEAFRDGWFHSGDSCVLDEDGLRVMVDRYKDVVKSGGENVASIRVESTLHQHPGVTRAAVVGLPHDRWGEAVTAIVVPAAAHRVDAQQLIAFCREHLAGYEVPKSVIYVEELPVTYEGGKVLKYQLRQTYQNHYR